MSMIEGLEGRRLLADTLLRVAQVDGDNRGEVTIRLSERATGVKGSAVQLYTAGADGKLFTDDDKRESVRFTYSENKKTIRLTAKLAKDTPYRVKLDGKTRIKSEASGTLLDGDNLGKSVSGDGRAGGNYEVQFNRDRSTTPAAVMRTSVGDIFMEMRGDVAPVSMNQFLGMANKANYDKMVITRSVVSGSPTVPDFVLQMGSSRITGDGQQTADVVENTAPSIPEELPRILSNLRGTLSYARNGLGNASTDFFINLGNNDATSQYNNLDVDTDTANDSIFTPFAQLVRTESFTTIDAAADKPIVNLASQFGGDPTWQSTPVNNATQASAGVNPNRDFVIIYRTAPLMIASQK